MKRKIALITGASSGIGAAFAKKFAELNYDLILVARRQSHLETLQQQLTSLKINVEIIVTDLSTQSGIESIVKTIYLKSDIDVLINNAGFVVYNKFYKSDTSILTKMISVHIQATLQLSHAALHSMLKQNSGIITNVASTAAFYPLNKLSIYAATKSFISLFTEGLARDYEHTALKFQSLCPGPTDTELFNKLDLNKAGGNEKLGTSLMTAEAVVEKSLVSLEKNKVICIPTFRLKLIIWLKIFLRFL